jgi:hypothetical protein
MRDKNTGEKNKSRRNFINNRDPIIEPLRGSIIFFFIISIIMEPLRGSYRVCVTSVYNSFSSKYDRKNPGGI